MISKSSQLFLSTALGRDGHVVIRPAVVGAQWREGGCCNKARIIPWHLCLTTRAFHLLLLFRPLLPSFPSHICHGELGSKELAALTNERTRRNERERRERVRGRGSGMRTCLQSESKILCRQFAVSEREGSTFEFLSPRFHPTIDGHRRVGVIQLTKGRTAEFVTFAAAAVE